MFGGTFGNPIKKNKLFNFFSIEDWKVGYPNSYVRTRCRPRSKRRATSRSPTASNPTTGIAQVRSIFDPYTTVINADGSVTRTPFPNNQIPQSRFDPLSASLMKQFWAPNNAGQNITGANNYEKGFIETYNYYNFSERADYNISDKWKIFGRVAHYNTTDIQANPTPNDSELFTPTGTARAGWDAGGDAVWTVNPRTVVEFRGSWHSLLDAYVSSPLPSSGWGSIWPNNNWYQTLHHCLRGNAAVLPGYEHRRTAIRRRRILLEPAPEG